MTSLISLLPEGDLSHVHRFPQGRAQHTYRLEQQEARTLGHLRSQPLSHANVSISSALVSLSGVHGSLQLVPFDFSPGVWSEEDPLKAGNPVDPTEEMRNNY